MRAVLVFGGRTFGELPADPSPADWTRVNLERDYLRDVVKAEHIDLLINGAARGADRLSSLVAHGLGVPVEEYPADWERYGKAAGPQRNAVMALRLVELRNNGWEVAGLGFPGGAGTENMAAKLASHGIPCRRVQP